MTLTLPQGPFAAYLFDLDGTLADTMPLHFVAWNRVLAEHGTSFPEELFYAWAGTPTRRIVEMLNGKFGLAMPPEEVTTRKEHAFFELLPTVRPIPEVLEHFSDQKGKIPFAVVSGGTREAVVRTLRGMGLYESFQAIVAAEDTPRGKPDPAPFLLAASRLGVEPSDCLVFEDADLGIESARAAGMKWVRVARERNANPISG